MNKRKLLLPAISIGLLTAVRPARADTIDLGVVAESIAVAGTLSGLTLAGNTIGGFTLGALTFVGSHLSDVINGNTVTSILETLIGAENAGTLDFNFPALGGASGTLAFNGNLTISNGQVTLSGGTLEGTLAGCEPSVPGAASQPGCHVGGTIDFNPYDFAGMIAAMENAQIITLPGGVTNGGTLDSTSTITIPLGSDAAGNTYQAEEIETSTSVSAAVQVPEPASSSLAAMGMAALAWWRRLRSKRS